MCISDDLPFQIVEITVNRFHCPRSSHRAHSQNCEGEENILIGSLLSMRLTQNLLYCCCFSTDPWQIRMHRVHELLFHVSPSKTQSTIWRDNSLCNAFIKD